MIEDARVLRETFVPSDVIPLISAFAVQDKGDARQAIKYLRKAGEIADKNGAEMVTEQTVREARSQVGKETVIEAMRR